MSRYEIVHGPKKFGVKDAATAAFMGVIGTFLIWCGQANHFGEPLSTAAGCLALLMSVVGTVLLIKNQSKGTPRLTLCPAGVRFEHGKKVYEARWDSIGPFKMIVQGRTKHLQAEVIGSDVTENVETEGIFFICFVALLDVDPYVLLEELNSCRETAFNSRHIVRQMRSLKTC